jgi:hypothetical protein
MRIGLADSGYAYRIPLHWAIPLPTAGATLVQDLHPSNRSPHGTHHDAIISNGNLCCPRHAPHAAGTRAASPRRHQRAGGRDRSVQARPHNPR